MSNKYLDVLTQVVRQPRHFVQETEAVAIEITQSRPPIDGTAPPEIIDFSRGGFRLKWGNPLEKREPIVLRFTDNTNGMSLELPGTVRWVRGIEGGRCEAGVQFDNAIDYEQLGELFIAGFLSTDDAS